MTYRVILNDDEEVSGENAREIVERLLDLEFPVDDDDRTVEAYMKRVARRTATRNPNKIIRTDTPENFLDDAEIAGIIERIA